MIARKPHADRVSCGGGGSAEGRRRFLIQFSQSEDTKVTMYIRGRDEGLESGR